MAASTAERASHMGSVGLLSGSLLGSGFRLGIRPSRTRLLTLCFLPWACFFAEAWAIEIMFFISSRIFFFDAMPYHARPIHLLPQERPGWLDRNDVHSSRIVQNG